MSMTPTERMHKWEDRWKGQGGKVPPQCYYYACFRAGRGGSRLHKTMWAQWVKRAHPTKPTVSKRRRVMEVKIIVDNGEMAPILREIAKKRGCGVEALVMSFVGRQLGQTCIPCAGMGFGPDGTTSCTVCRGNGINPNVHMYRQY